MTIDAVTRTFANFAQQVVSGTPAPVNPNTPAAQAQEAAETLAQTVKEAQKNDPIAKQKLLKLQAQQQQKQAPQPKASEPGKGTAVDHVG